MEIPTCFQDLVTHKIINMLVLLKLVIRYGRLLFVWTETWVGTVGENSERKQFYKERKKEICQAKK